MASIKQRPNNSGLYKRIRQRRELVEDVEDTASSGVADLVDHSPDRTSETVHDDTESDPESDVEALDVSFGAMAKAQSLFSQSDRKKRSSLATVNEDTWDNNEARERKSGRKDNRDFNRASKHAPMELSSKKAVSRKRAVVPIAKPEYRDPRFEPFTESSNSSGLNSAYSFLDDYRDSEMQELRSAIKNSKDEVTKEKLKRALMSMESKKAVELRKTKERDILDRHRREEKELVRQGKKPYYLKRAEQKKRVLVDQFRELKGKRLDHAIQRRRKKIEGKEKKHLPFTRRVVE